MAGFGVTRGARKDEGGCGREDEFGALGATDDSAKTAKPRPILYLLAPKDLSTDYTDGRRSRGNACGAKSRHILRRRRQPNLLFICAHLRHLWMNPHGNGPGVRKEDSLPSDIIQAPWLGPDQPVKTPVQSY